MWDVSSQPEGGKCAAELKCIITASAPPSRLAQNMIFRMSTGTIWGAGTKWRLFNDDLHHTCSSTDACALAQLRSFDIWHNICICSSQCVLLHMCTIFSSAYLAISASWPHILYITAYSTVHTLYTSKQSSTTKSPSAPISFSQSPSAILLLLNLHSQNPRSSKSPSKQIFLYTKSPL